MSIKFLFFVSIVFLFSCVNENKNKQPKAIKEVRTFAVGKKELPNEILGFGALSYQKKYNISASQDGVLKKLYFREGDVIHAGNIIAELSNEQIELAVGRAENEFATAQASLRLSSAAYIEARYSAEAQMLSLEKADAELEEALKRYKESERKFIAQMVLFEAGGVSEEAIRLSRFALEAEASGIELSKREIAIRRVGFREKDLIEAGFTVPLEKAALDEAFIDLATVRAKAEVNAAQERVLAAEKELRSTLLSKSELVTRAPASGVLAMRYFEEGERVKKEEKLFTLMDTKSLCVSVPVRESDALRITKGGEAFVALDSTNTVFKGVVDLVFPYADSQSFTFMVRILISGETIGKNYAKPGMFARVVINAGAPREVIVLNSNCISGRQENKATVFVVNGKQLHERLIVLGEVIEGGWEVIDGLKEGELLALNPDSTLQDGEYVSIAR
ncbi:MAG: efflux RND transporter periplasmic adaptor subunit [Spirochaetaceae bacterium]|jgi:multidrug efflux pump subunit AcrA (membrane-fusion protein)|nr:efflux RND transporter periplasmic adaptor subunit [Spirochaetaceae bacterium]